MADFSFVCVALCFFLLILDQNFAVSSSVSASPEKSSKFQRRSLVVKKKKKGEVLIGMKQQTAASYYPRYYPISPIQFYPVPVPMVYQPMMRPRYRPRRPPPSAPPVVEVIDEVTPFYNFIQRHLIPSYMKDFSRIAALSKKTVYHYHSNDDEPAKHKPKRRPKPKSSQKYHNIPPNVQKPMIWADDSNDSFYYTPQVKKSKRPTIKLHPEEYNEAILEAFSPAWEESSADHSVASRNSKSNLSSDSSFLPRDLPTNSNEDSGESAEETQFTYQWLHPTSTTKRPKETRLTSSSSKTASPSLFFRSTDDYLNPIYQHLPLYAQNIRNSQKSTIGLPGQNRSNLLYLPVPHKQSAQLKLSKNQIPTPLALTPNDDDKSMSYPSILTTSTTTTTTTSTTTTKKPIVDQTFRPVSVIKNSKTNSKDSSWKAMPTNKKRKDLDASPSTFRKALQVVRPLAGNMNSFKSHINGVHYYKPVESRLLERPVSSSTASNLIPPKPSMAVTVGTMMDFSPNSQQNRDSASDFFPGVVIDESIGMTTDPDVFEINASPSKSKKVKQKTKLFVKNPLKTVIKNAPTSKWKPLQLSENYLKPKNLSKPFRFDLPNSVNSMRQLAVRDKAAFKSTPLETKEDIKKLHKVFDEIDRVSSQKSKKFQKQTVLTELPKRKIQTTKVSSKENNVFKKTDKPAEVRKFCTGRETGYYADVNNNCKVSIKCKNIKLHF